MVIEVNAKDRLRRGRAFVLFMLVLSMTGLAFDGTADRSIGVVDIVMMFTASVWALIAWEYTRELRMIGLQDKR